MNFFKTAPAAPSAENAAAAARLSAVVGRGQAELDSYPTYPDPPNAPGVQRRFWTPEELAADDSSD